VPKITRTAAKAGSGRSLTGAAKQSRAAAKAVASAKTTKRQSQAGIGPSAGETAADVLVELPGGTARITIHANAGVQRAARDWLRLVETLARASVSPTELRDQLPHEPVGQQLTPAEVNELEEAGARRAPAATSTAVRADALAWQVHATIAAPADRTRTEPLPRAGGRRTGLAVVLSRVV